MPEMLANEYLKSFIKLTTFKMAKHHLHSKNSSILWLK